MNKTLTFPENIRWDLHSTYMATLNRGVLVNPMWIGKTDLINLDIMTEVGHHHKIGNSKTNGKNKQATNHGGINKIAPHMLLKPEVRIGCTSRLIDLGGANTEYW